MIEIEDISNLLKALFKVNIDIAHREYFLRIDVPEISNWWYGYQEVSENETKWISFEPMVELKFSNLHSDNQLDEEGNLICTVSDNIKTYPRKWSITPVNRELQNSPENECVQYNDFHYFYDFKQSWQGTWKMSDSTGSRLLPSENSDKLDDSQNFYEVKPLCLYENTQL
jgi:hypothetical protein